MLKFSATFNKVEWSLEMLVSHATLHQTGYLGLAVVFFSIAYRIKRKTAGMEYFFAHLFHRGALIYI